MIWPVKKTILGYNESVLMYRYILLKTPWFGLYVHKFMRSDFERAFHDHPWHFVTLIIKGKYIEHTPKGDIVSSAPRLRIRKATWQHWVEVPKPPVWTLILVSRRARKWGFILPNGDWCWWRRFNRTTLICEDEPIYHNLSD